MLLIGTAFADDVNLPNYTGFVNDFAGALSPDSVKTLEQVCRSLESKTSAELAIAVVKTAAPLDSKEYAVKLFEKWKIGKKGKDNGILLLVAVDERRVEIEVGYGLEGTITDATAGRILDEYVVPYFKQGKMDEGVIGGARAIADKIGGTEKEEPIKQETAMQNSTPLYTFLIVAGVLILLTLITRMGFYHFLGGIMGAVAGYYYINGIFGIIMGAVIGFIFGAGVIMYGGWGGGGGGGGFGGFGGGRSGGGGSGRDF